MYFIHYQLVNRGLFIFPVDEKGQAIPTGYGGVKNLEKINTLSVCLLRKLTLISGQTVFFRPPAPP